MDCIVHGVAKSWTRLSDFHFLTHLIRESFPGGSADKESACNVGDLDLILGLGRSPGEGNSYPLQYSGLENSMALQSIGSMGSMGYIVHGVSKSQTQ